LDILLGGNNFSTGRELLEANSIRAGECLDSDTDNKAGYYCMIEGRPISRENSIGDISWFPAGSDLARISKRAFSRLGALRRIK
jgi:hypothetical protein